MYNKWLSIYILTSIVRFQMAGIKKFTSYVVYYTYLFFIF